ncbi:CZB domain-containing protein [Adhaeribacter aquaticus]|uniref:CZB domain-containing protein n=1 Tax=Adhaeribacter aquaticus TaxID=299567 RepID=UPI0004061744|nr:CZB domain-containing protein [Adhaeribacter aquaticus]
MLNSQVNLNSLDIQQARIKFILFKSKLRSILYGGTLDDTLLSPRDNALGQWLYTSALNKYSYIPEIRELERLNVHVTRQAQDLVNLYKRGKIEEARNGLGNLDFTEEELTRLISVIQTKAAA